MLQDTMVVLTTEFGRTPKINGNEGRDHYPKAFSSIMAGGGIHGGQIYGKTDKGGHEVAENKVLLRLQCDQLATASACRSIK